LVPVVAVIFYIVVTLAVLCFESFLVWGAARIWLRPGASWMEVLRPIALANAPRLADVLLTLGQGEALLAPLCGGWQLAAFVVGVEAAVSRGWAIALGLTLSIGVFRWLLFALLIGA
jgi:hypothetical protein